jgi:hypothetical protein
MITRRDKPTEWKKSLAGYSSNKGLTYRIYQDLRKLNTRRTNDPVNGQMNQAQYPKEVQMANKYMKNCSLSLAI